MPSKAEIMQIRELTTQDLLSAGFTVSELCAMGELEMVPYSLGEYAYYDGNYYYNESGQTLRHPEEYDPNSEGYTPFGDE